MKAARFYGIGDVRFEEIPKPTFGPDEVLVKVAYAGICGSDLHIYNKQMFIENIPETMGHEFSGIVEEVGSNVTSFRPGDKVMGNPMVTCGTCAGCQKDLPNTCQSLAFIGEVRPGCFAEYIVLPPESLIPLSEGIDLRKAALTEPLAVAVNLCERMHLTPEKSLAVLGVGPIGLLTILLTKQVYGVERITACGRSQYRLDLAKEVGAEEVVTKLSEDSRYDSIVEAAGKEVTFAQAVAHTNPNGEIGVVSIFEDDFVCDINQLVAAQITLIGCNAYEERHLVEAALLIAENQVDVEPLISREFTLEECAKAFQFSNEPEKKAAKVLFQVNA